MEKILTISVAAYNVERYLCKLLDNIIESERSPKLDVIVVNDGSTDSTSSIAARYADRYPGSIRLIDKEDEGHGSTINRGIKEAKGKYFKALDGDDWLDANALAKLVDLLENCDSDLVVCGHKFVYESDGTEREVKMGLVPEVEYSLDDAIRFLFGLQYHDVYYKSALLVKNAIKLTEYSFYTDSELVIYPLAHVKTVTRYDVTPYCYRIGVEGQSVSIKGFQKHQMEHRDILMKLLDHYRLHESEWSQNMKIFHVRFIGVLVGMHIGIFFSYPLSIKRLKELIIFDDQIKRFPDIYRYMEIRSFRIWRYARVIMYVPVHLWCGYKFRLKSGPHKRT